jgi:hypothetical protein
VAGELRLTTTHIAPYRALVGTAFRIGRRRAAGKKILQKNNVGHLRRQSVPIDIGGLHTGRDRHAGVDKAEQIIEVPSIDHTVTVEIATNEVLTVNHRRKQKDRRCHQPPNDTESADPHDPPRFEMYGIYNDCNFTVLILR